MEKRTSVFENGLIWFGAAVSIAEILTGTYFAPLGFNKGTLGAIFLPLTDITGFLYFIGSVFAPMIAIQIADFFILKQNSESSSFNIQNLIIWLVGFVCYRILMNVDIIVGSTLADVVLTIIICMFSKYNASL